MLAFPRRRWWSVLAASGCLLLVALACGRLLVETQAIDVATVPLLLAAAGALVGLAAMFIGPVACLAAVVAFGMMPLLPKAAALSGIDLGAGDAFYLGLLGWLVATILKPGSLRGQAPGLRSTPVLLLLGFAGLSLLHVLVVDPGELQTSFVSWVRLVQTMSIAFIAALLLRSTRDVRFVLTAVAIAGVAVVAIGLTGVAGGAESEGAFEGRAGGVAGPNTVGLIAGLLLLLACLGTLGPSLLYRVPLAIVGAAGLAESQSIGSIVATSVALVLAIVLGGPRRPTVPGLRATKGLTAVLLALAIAYAVGMAVRPANLPGSESFQSSSAWHRTVVGSAGVELALRNPVIGVGWRRSSKPEVIGDPDLGTELRARFTTTREEFFPHVEPTSVHNAYVQIAADLGFVGLGLLLLVLWTLGSDTARLIRGAAPGSESRRLLWFLAWGVVLILIWLNDNPLFGGQPETVLLASFVGAIAALGRLRPA